MKKLFLIITFAILLISCSGTQKATSNLQSGNYVGAFNTSIAQLNKDKTKKPNQKHIPLLKEAYTKAAAADLNGIASLKNSNTPDALKKVYGKYLNLDLRQDEVKVLQPLYYEGREMVFEFDDYTNKVKKAKDNYASSLYNLATKELKGDVQGARKAHKHLEELIYVHPTYKSNLDDLLKKAKNQGSSFVLVTLKNNIRSISKDSLKSFTRINSGNFDNQWVVYHDKKDHKIRYGYQIDVILNKFTLEPEKTQQQTVPQQAKVQDGWQYQLDANGNVMKDNKGNDMKVAKYKIVKAEIMLYQQSKISKLDGTITIKNIKNNTTISTKPEFGEAKFQNTYGKYRGDQRAIEQKYAKALQAKEAPYPKDYEFVKYSISNFKQKVTALLSQQQF